MQPREPIRRILQTVRLEILERAAFDPAALSETITISKPRAPRNDCAYTQGLAFRELCMSEVRPGEAT
jgi:hypothetical protein